MDEIFALRFIPEDVFEWIHFDNSQRQSEIVDSPYCASIKLL